MPPRGACGRRRQPEHTITGNVFCERGCGQPRSGFGIAFRCHRDSVPACRDSIPLSRDNVPRLRQRPLLVKALRAAMEPLPFFYLFLPDTSCGQGRILPTAFEDGEPLDSNLREGRKLQKAPSTKPRTCLAAAYKAGLFIESEPKRSVPRDGTATVSPYGLSCRWEWGIPALG
jgi:hypothetical protein